MKQRNEAARRERTVDWSPASNDADDPLDRLGCVDGVERGEHEVTGLGGRQRDLDGLAVAHLADEDHLRRLAQGSAQGQRERRRVAVQLALVHRRLLVNVEELDGIFDGEDVFGARLVDEIDQRRERRRLARAGRPGDQHDPVLEGRDLLERSGQIQLGQRGNLRGDHAHHDGVCPSLTEDVDAEARALRQRPRQVAGSLLLQRAQRLFGAANQIAGDAGDVDRLQHRQLGDGDRRQVAVLLHLRWPAGREDQIADAPARVEHRDDQRGRGDGVLGEGAEDFEFVGARCGHMGLWRSSCRDHTSNGGV